MRSELGANPRQAVLLWKRYNHQGPVSHLEMAIKIYNKAGRGFNWLNRFLDFENKYLLVLGFMFNLIILFVYFIGFDLFKVTHKSIPALASIKGEVVAVYPAGKGLEE